MTKNNVPDDLNQDIKPDTLEKNMPEKKKSGDSYSSVIIAVLLAVLFRSLLFEPFNIPSGSMKPTLLVGDYIFTTKYAYGYSRYSFPFGINIFSGRKFFKEPERGDVVVFMLPTNTKIHYVKRLIGLPGDKIQVKEGILYINGQKIPKKRIEDFIDIDEKGNKQIIRQYLETLPNNVSYKVLDETDKGGLDNTQVYTVPEHHYFFMGDNRDNSQDSRVMEVVGFVPEENLVGPARLIFFSAIDHVWEFWKFRNERYLKHVKYEETTK